MKVNNVRSLATTNKMSTNNCFIEDKSLPKSSYGYSCIDKRTNQNKCYDLPKKSVIQICRKYENQKHRPLIATVEDFAWLTIVCWSIESAIMKKLHQTPNDMHSFLRCCSMIGLFYHFELFATTEDDRLHSKIKSCPTLSCILLFLFNSLFGYTFAFCSSVNATSSIREFYELCQDIIVAVLRLRWLFGTLVHLFVVFEYTRILINFFSLWTGFCSLFFVLLWVFVWREVIQLYFHYLFHDFF